MQEMNQVEPQAMPVENPRSNKPMLVLVGVVLALLALSVAGYWYVQTNNVNLPFIGNSENQLNIDENAIFPQDEEPVETPFLMPEQLPVD